MAMELVKYPTDHGEVSLDIAQVKRLFCPLATDVEAIMFLKTCLYQQLNPFLSEVYLIKYEAGRPAKMVVGKDAFTKRASKRSEFNGYEAGIIVQRGEVILEEVGAAGLPGDKLLGGWANVHRKDWGKPVSIKVSLAEYNAGQASWRQMPATMIRKVALVQALREAFPDTFQGLYDESEMAQAIAPLSRPEIGTKEEPQQSFVQESCRLHNIPWVPAGISRKTGQPYPAFHKLPDGSYCRKPRLSPDEAEPEAPAAEVPLEAPVSTETAPTTAPVPEEAPMPSGEPSAPREETTEAPFARFVDLYNWGLRNGWRSKQEIWKDLGVRGEVEITDLGAAQAKLKALKEARGEVKA